MEGKGSDGGSTALHPATAYFLHSPAYLPMGTRRLVGMALSGSRRYLVTSLLPPHWQESEIVLQDCWDCPAPLGLVSSDGMESDTLWALWEGTRSRHSWAEEQHALGRAHRAAIQGGIAQMIPSHWRKCTPTKEEKKIQPVILLSGVHQCWPLFMCRYK
jgi:hypothetical protein